MPIKINPQYIDATTRGNQLKKHLKDQLFSYFQSTSYSEDIIAEIVNKNFIDSNPPYYLFYPYLFSSYFQINDEEIIELLSISGFLYYRSVIIMDNIFDAPNSSNNFKNFLIATICQEETIKILSSFFKRSADFWEIWNIRKQEYVKAYQLDKTLTEIQSYSQYEELADYKSTFGKIAIDCLFHLSGKKDQRLYELLLESHKWFYVGFQIMDDILDYKEDVNNGQFNISKYELINALNKGGYCIDNFSIVEQQKLIYLEGVSIDLYNKAINYLENAYSLLENSTVKIDLCLWKNEIINLHNTAVSHLLNIKGFIDVFESEQECSKDFIMENDVNTAIKNALGYIIKKQASEGNWTDIFNDAGISDVWTTAYIVHALSRSNLASSSSLLKAKKFIVKNRLPNGLWGYNTQWVEDADSSSFALLNLKDLDCLDKWFQYQNQDGGFSTYNNKNTLLASLNSTAIQDVNGWMQSHFCVSAVAYLVFIELKLTSGNNFSALRDYLIKELNSGDEILSYWWANDIYAIYHILLGAEEFGDREISALCEEKLEKIMLNELPNLFFKGLLLSTLCLNEQLFDKHKIKVYELAHEILLNQYTDGSWGAGYSLKIPYPSVININDNKIAWKKSSKGTNILVKDYNRIFTTVSCLISLKMYEKQLLLFNYKKLNSIEA